MIKLSILGIATTLSVAIATPVFGQAAIQEPGAYAFYHPNSDLGAGSSRAAADAAELKQFRYNGLYIKVEARKSHQHR